MERCFVATRAEYQHDQDPGNKALAGLYPAGPKKESQKLASTRWVLHSFSGCWRRLDS